MPRRDFSIPLEQRPVRLVHDAGTVYDRHGNDRGMATKGSEWVTMSLDWQAGGSEDNVYVVLVNEAGDSTSVFPPEMELIE